MGNGFSQVNAGSIILINKAVLFEIIEKRIYETKVKIEDLFLLCKAPNDLEGEQDVDTPYGKLKVFFIKQDLKKSWLLHKSKYDYPKISKVSSRGSHTTKDESKSQILHGPQTCDLTSLVKIKEAYKN